MKQASWRKLFLAATNFIFFSLGLQAQSPCDFSDDFSNPIGWTQVGELVTIQNGVVAYQDGSFDSEQRRVYKNLGVSLTANNTWTAEVDFTPISVGDYNGPHAGHAILSLTAGSQEPFSNCPDVPCTGYPAPQQDGIVCMFGSPGNPSNGNSYFMIFAIEGSDASEYSSTPIKANALGVPYFVRLERLSPTLVRLSVFSDAARTIHLPGSPVALAVPASIEGLSTVQHGNIARGGSYRELTGALDNLCINWDIIDTCPTDRTLPAIEGSAININTGVDENLNPLPFGSIDPRWTIVSNTLPPMSTLDRLNFPDANSHWIGFDNNQGSDETNYQVRFTFCTEACGNYRLNFRMLADNNACVYLDGNLVPSNWMLNNVPIPDCSYTPDDQSSYIPTEGYLISRTVALSSGLHTLEIDVTNISGSMTSMNVLGTIRYVQPCQTLSTNSATAQKEDLRLFPNPAQDQITVAWENTTPQNIILYDALGRAIRSIENSTDTKQLEISLTGLQPGSYFLTWQDNTGRIFSQRFVKI